MLLLCRTSSGGEYLFDCADAVSFLMDGACVRTCVRACVCACAHACVSMCASVHVFFVAISVIHHNEWLMG